MKSFYLKLILILVFLSVNIFFLFRIAELYKLKNTFSDEEISSFVEVMCEKGIKIDQDTIIREKNVPKVIKLNFNSSASEAVASRIMRDEYGSFTIPDGYRYTNDTESLSFSYDYTIEYVYLPRELSKEFVESQLSTAQGVDEKGKKAEKALTRAFFKDMNSDPYNVSIKAKRSFYVNGITYIRAIQCVDSYEIEGAEIIAALDKETPVFISGRLFFAEDYYDYKTDAFDSINILFEIEPENSVIDDMDLTYSFVFDDKSAVYLTPSYRFIYSNGEKKIYDATSGAKRYS